MSLTNSLQLPTEAFKKNKFLRWNINEDFPHYQPTKIQKISQTAHN